MELELKGRTALVMGSSDGIGRGIAESLCAEGVQVAVVARGEEKLAKTAREIGAKKFYVVDLSKPGASAKLVEDFLADFGAIDILVTNTGGPARGDFMKINEDQWH